MLAQSHPFTALTRATYIRLTTYRKTGEAVATPVWFAEHTGTIFVETSPNAGKVKRVRHTARVTLEPCTLQGKVTGAGVEGNARILTDVLEIATARAAMAKKYGLLRRLYYGFWDVLHVIQRKPKNELSYLGIEPARQ